MRRPVTYTCGAFHSWRHRPHCTPSWRADDGCWCFLYYDRLSARAWRAGRRSTVRGRRRFQWPPPPPPVISWKGLL